MLPQQPQHRSAVRAPSAHAGAGGNIFGQMNGKTAAVDACGAEKQPCGLDAEIAVVTWNFTGAAFHFPRLTGTKLQPQRNLLHDHFKVMIAVRAAAQHVQRQVQLGVSHGRKTDHTRIFPSR